MSDSIEISVNGVNAMVNSNSVITDYLHLEQIEGRFLVVLNDEVIPKSAHQSTNLHAGDRIDIMSPISGG